MIKQFFLISKKPELTASEFRHYYESHHVPLIKRLFPMFARYRRHYLDRENSALASDQPDPDFDVITEIWFARPADYDAFIERVSYPEVITEIRTDEANFLISDATRSLRMETCE